MNYTFEIEINDFANSLYLHVNDSKSDYRIELGRRPFQVNENIKTDYTITDTSNPITYDGSLLKKCGILLNNLDSSFSFDIYITNNLDQEFKCTIFINIPTKLDDKSLYDGTITLKQNTNYIFYRYK